MMRKIRFVSDKFPGISIPVRNIPGLGTAGSYEFKVGFEYQVTQETLEDIRAAMRGYPPAVSEHLWLESNEDEAGDPSPAEGGESEDWVTTNLAKLRVLTANEAEPHLEKVAMSVEIPLEQRRTLMEKVSGGSQFPQRVRKKASELLSRLNQPA